MQTILWSAFSSSSNCFLYEDASLCFVYISCHLKWFSWLLVWYLIYVIAGQGLWYYDFTKNDLFINFILHFLGNGPDRKPISQTICTDIILLFVWFVASLCQGNCWECLITTRGWLTQPMWKTVWLFPTFILFLLSLIIFVGTDWLGSTHLYLENINICVETHQRLTTKQLASKSMDSQSQWFPLGNQGAPIAMVTRHVPILKHLDGWQVKTFTRSAAFYLTILKPFRSDSVLRLIDLFTFLVNRPGFYDGTHTLSVMIYCLIFLVSL